MVRERQADGLPEMRGPLKTRSSATGKDGMRLSPEITDLIREHVERYAEADDPDAPLMPTERGQHVDANTFGFYLRKARRLRVRETCACTTCGTTPSVRRSGPVPRWPRRRLSPGTPALG
jgi:hypothetical protein